MPGSKDNISTGVNVGSQAWDSLGSTFFVMEGQFMSDRGLSMDARVNLHYPAAGLEPKRLKSHCPFVMKTGSQPFNIASSPELI